MTTSSLEVRQETVRGKMEEGAGKERKAFMDDEEPPEGKVTMAHTNLSGHTGHVVEQAAAILIDNVTNCKTLTLTPPACIHTRSSYGE